MLLVISNKEDITTDFIVNKLNIQAIPYFRLNTEDLFSRYSISFDFTREQFFIIDRNKDITLDLTLVKAVYFRRPIIPSVSQLDLSIGESHFIYQEYIATLDGLYRVLDDRFWVSKIYSIREAENKIYQILLAKRLGFSIPNSLITTEALAAKRFISENSSNCIIKPIRTGFIDDQGAERVIFTSKLGPTDISALNDISDCPIYLQNNIPKIADLRVTVVGDTVFAAKINSQSQKESSIDWRKGDTLSLAYEQCTLPNKLHQQCLELVKTLGLQFGAIDFALDSTKNFVFLEINPNGQWAWIENRVGYNISGELINLLLKNGRDEI